MLTTEEATLGGGASPISICDAIFDCIGRNQPNLSLRKWNFNISSSKLLVDHKVKITQNGVPLPGIIDPDIKKKIQRGITKANEVDFRRLYKR